MCGKPWWILLVSGLFWSCGGPVEMVGRSPVGSIYLSPRPKPQQKQKRPVLPSHLVLEKKAFIEPSGNRALDAGEEGSLRIKVGNNGLGPADVAVRLMPLGSPPERVLGRYRGRDGDVPDSVFEPLTGAERDAWGDDG